MHKPNIILIMCDDLGYGDTGFNGNTIIQTPHLDALCARGARFTQFFAGGPVCSPTRGTCLTGRHYARYGITHANVGALPREEYTLAEMCKEQHYQTGHFGKWHLGTLSKTERDGNRGGAEHAEEYSPPWEHHFDVCFSTESKVPTWDPQLIPDEKNADGTYTWGKPGTEFPTAYWNEHGERVNDNLHGDDSRVIMDRALHFIEQSTQHAAPFLSVIWFHAPHTPVVAGPRYRKRYAQYSEEEQHYYGCITAMDEQVGRLQQTLHTLGIEDHTMIWFCSDNGPEGSEDLSKNGRSRGRTGGLRGRKRSLFNGGIGVPAFVVWPNEIAAGIDLQTPCSTLDYLPSIAAYLGHRLPERPYDGCNIIPIVKQETSNRDKPIPYRFVERKEKMFGAPTFALIDNDWKFMTHMSEHGQEDILFHISNDQSETRNLIAQEAQRAQNYRNALSEFFHSCKESHYGTDYPHAFQPLHSFQASIGTWANSE